MRQHLAREQLHALAGQLVGQRPRLAAGQDDADAQLPAVVVEPLPHRLRPADDGEDAVLDVPPGLLLRQEQAAVARDGDGGPRRRVTGRRQADALVGRAREVADVSVIAATVSVPDDKVLREMGDIVRSKLDSPGVIVLASVFDERVGIQVSVDAALTKRGLHAGKIAGAVGGRLGGKGGGRPESAQGGGKNKAELDAALNLVITLVKEQLK